MKNEITEQYKGWNIRLNVTEYNEIQPATYICRGVIESHERGAAIPINGRPENETQVVQFAERTFATPDDARLDAMREAKQLIDGFAPQH